MFELFSRFLDKVRKNEKKKYAVDIICLKGGGKERGGVGGGEDK